MDRTLVLHAQNSYMQFEIRNVVNHQLPKASVVAYFSNTYKIA